MRIIFPYTKRIDEVIEALPPNTNEFFMNDSHSYPDLLQAMWDIGESFVIVEHDVVAPDLSEIMECPEDWCAYGYKDDAESFLGCVKISKKIIETIPHVWRLMPNRVWNLCDVHFKDVATKAGFTVHQHYPSLKHIKAAI